MRPSKHAAAPGLSIEVIDLTPDTELDAELVREPDELDEVTTEIRFADGSGLLFIDRTACAESEVCQYCRRAAAAPTFCRRCKRWLCAGCHHGLCSTGMCAPRPQGDGVR